MHRIRIEKDFYVRLPLQVGLLYAVVGKYPSRCRACRERDCAFYNPSLDLCDYLCRAGRRRGCPPGKACTAWRERE